MRRTSTKDDQLLLWQDVRARAIDEHLDSDRRAVGERVAELSRWLFVLVFAALVNLDHLAGGQAQALYLNAALLAWAAANTGISVLLWRRYRPGRRFSAATLVMDLLLAAAILGLGAPGTNPFVQAYLVSVVVAAVRLGRLATLATALAEALLLLGLRGFHGEPAEAGWVFLYVVAGLVSQQITTELERERRMAISRAAQADALREMSVNMASSLDIKDVFTVILEHAVRITVADRGCLLLLNGEQVQLAAGEPDPKAEARAVDVAGRGEAAFLDNRSALLVPVASGDGITAVLALRARSRPFTNEDLFMVNALAGSTAVPLANAMHFQRSAEEATTDGLTGLLNHREFRRRLDAEFARRQHRSTPLSLMLIDIDNFKQVNDSLGHQHGDEVIRAAARLARETARAHDVVARYGGDELAVILPDAGPEGALALAQRLLEVLHAAAIEATPERRLTFSIGVASYPEDAIYVEELVMAADQALYLAKREGRDRAATCAALVSKLRDPELMISMLSEAGPQVMVAAAHAMDSEHVGMRAHSSRVAALAEALGERAGYPHSLVERLRAVAFLHQVGEVMAAGDGERHAELGEGILSRGPFPPEVPLAVRHHHERWDGGGYPDGISGEQIPVEARILSLADRFELLTAGRSGPALSVTDALSALEAEQGAFDPGLLAALRALVEEGSLALSAPTALSGAAR